MCAQRNPRSACADQNLPCPLEDALDYLATNSVPRKDADQTAVVRMMI